MPTFQGLPPGLVLNRSTGAITGTIPADATHGTYQFTVETVDVAGNIACQAYEIVVREPS